MSAQYSGPTSLTPTSSRYRRYISSVSCDNSVYGCSKRFSTIEERLEHKNLCEFEPNVDIKCDDCQKVVLRSQLKRHNCIKELRSAINELKDIINGLEAKVNQQIIQMTEAKQILEASPQIVTITDETDGLDQYYSENNQPKQEVFESEPEIIEFREPERQMSSELPEKSSYRRFDKQISEEVEFSMYGSQKYKYLAQLSRGFDGTLPPIDYETNYSIDLKKKNKEKLIDIIRDNDYSGDKPSLVRLRSWSERD